MSDWDQWLEAIARAEREMVDGYFDGFDPEAPAPSGNRSRSYQHGFRNGRADKRGKPAFKTIEDAKHRAAVAIALDAGVACPVLHAM